MPLQAVMPCRSSQVRQRGLQGTQAVIQRQQRVVATRDHQSFFLQRQYGGAWWFRAYGRIVHLRSFLPLRHGGEVQVITLGQCGIALWTLLDDAAHRRGRAGAAVS